jgi:hypothetical protein
MHRSTVRIMFISRGEGCDAHAYIAHSSFHNLNHSVATLLKIALLQKLRNGKQNSFLITFCSVIGPRVNAKA